MNIVIFGPPGAGKGTQSALLVERRKMKHISTGDLFRENMKNETELGIKAKGFVDNGQLVPDEIVIGMVGEVFRKLEGTNFILDGFPRTAPQAKALESLLEKHGLSIDRAIFLDVPEAFLVERLTGRRICRGCGAVFHKVASPSKIEGECDKCGGELYQRKDDHEDVIKTRFGAYKDGTAPLVEYYRSTGIYKQVDGTGSSEAVYAAIESALK